MKQALHTEVIRVRENPKMERFIYVAYLADVMGLADTSITFMSLMYKIKKV